MKRKGWIILLSVAVLFAVLFVPVVYKYRDGGTRVYAAVTYKVIDWNRVMDDGVYEKTRFYFFPDNLRSIDELWEQEQKQIHHRFRGTVLDVKGKTVLVEPLEGETERNSCDCIAFVTDRLEDIGVKIGDVVQVTYTGYLYETYPASIDVVDWEISYDLRHLEYSELKK